MSTGTSLKKQKDLDFQTTCPSNVPNVRNFRQKCHYRLRGTNAGKHRCVYTQEQLNVSLIHNFYLFFAYLNRPSVQPLSGNKHPTTLHTTDQSISQRVSRFQGPAFIFFEHLWTPFHLKPKSFVCPLSRESYTIARGHLLSVLSGRQHPATLQKECILPDPLESGRYISMKV